MFVNRICYFNQEAASLNDWLLSSGAWLVHITTLTNVMSRHLTTMCQLTIKSDVGYQRIY